MNSFENLFIFSKNQKKGAAILIIILLFIHFIPKAYFNSKPASPKTLHIPELTKKDRSPLDSIGINTVDTLVLKSLPGIGSILSTRIVRFRKAKNGFNSLKELKNVYGLSPETYNKILPYLYLDSFPRSPSPTPNRFRQKFYSKSKKSLRTPKTIDINTANKQDFQQLPGIGKVLSGRIIRFREAKGGFSDPSEIQKVYQLPDSTFQRIRPYLQIESEYQGPSKKEIQSNDRITEEKLSAYSLETPVNINTADSALFMELPGIWPTLAKRIIAYRKQIGFFSQKEYLAQVYGISPDKLSPLLPHITVGDLTNYKKEDLNMIPDWKLKKYPFWTESELNAFLLWKKKIRRVDSWQEIESSQTVDIHTLEQLQMYFHL